MIQNSIRDRIDLELKHIEMKEELKNNIRNACAYRQSKPVWRSIVVCFAVVILGGTTVFATNQIRSRIYVNEDVLPDLAPMEIVQINDLDVVPDENGFIDTTYRDYDEIKDALGVKLLDTELSNDNPYMLCRLDTNAKDYASITVDNFILGDTSNYNLVESGKRYSYEHGTEYISPASLEVALILSESQLNMGWNVDYLGLYEFVESYTSSQGYKVNILQTTVMEEGLEDFVSTKVAVFVVDGVQYTLKGQFSLDTLKNIINTMHPS